MNTPKLFRFKNATIDLNVVYAIGTPVMPGGAIAEKYEVTLYVKDSEEFVGELGVGHLAAHKEYERLLDRWGADK